VKLRVGGGLRTRSDARKGKVRQPVPFSALPMRIPPWYPCPCAGVASARSTASRQPQTTPPRTIAFSEQIQGSAIRITQKAHGCFYVRYIAYAPVAHCRWLFIAPPSAPPSRLFNRPLVSLSTEHRAPNELWMANTGSGWEQGTLLGEGR
jgi:hypothetical protein